MSTDPTQNVGKTLTGGIQDVAALLPLLGTDQCEQHVGSALHGGYLYAAAAPLSIFGSLGIVKAGISILISSISIPKISISLHPFTMTFSQERWLGARTLNNAGFKLAGTVAPLIAIDGKRYKAETRLMQILDEKHIDNPKNLSIEWKSRDWNVSLVLFTMVAAVMSGTPYIVLLLQKSGPSLTHTPWIFPLLRSVGSYLTAVCCQFLIQSRVISLMKNRIIFMVMNRSLIDDLLMHDKVEMDSWVKEYVRWDVDLPAEECLWSLKQFLSSSFTQPMDSADEVEDYASITMLRLSFPNPRDISRQLQELHDEHFATPAFDHAFMLISWVILCLSLPATVAGYIGCFTLVSNSQDNGPLIWLGLEAALSIIRIAVWASNPSSDEETYIAVNLKLTEDQPLVTTEKNDEIIKATGTLALVPERRFLEWITPYTGPLEQFDSPENLALYFTLVATYRKQKCLYMTVFDFNKRIAVTLHRDQEGFVHVDADVTCNRNASEMEAVLQSEIGEKHPWRTNDAILFDKLAKYYEFIMHALNRTHLHSRASDNSDAPPITRATLRWKWSLFPKQNESNKQSRYQHLEPPSTTQHDQLYLNRGSEHRLKTGLIKDWTEWIVVDMRNIRSDTQNDCHHALADAASEKAKWELTELDSQLAWEWTRRELSLILSSMQLEGILKQRMDKCIDEVAKEQGNGRLKEWMSSEFVIGQRNRLEKEREEMKDRMEKEKKGANECAEREGRPWGDQELFSPQYQWEAGLKFIDKQWSAGIEGGHPALENVVSELDELVKKEAPPAWLRGDLYETRLTFVKQFRQRFERWNPQRQNERLEMDATIERISKADSEHLSNAYKYPDPEESDISRFVTLRHSQSQGRVSSATVYDVEGCGQDVIHNVIRKSTTRSVTNVDPYLVDSIPKNEHLLYVGSDSRKEPAFVQQNRERWWDQQTSNASIFYFSPQAVTSYGEFVLARQSTIAHIFIFLKTQTRLRLSLLHMAQSPSVAVSIQENGEEHPRISTEGIPGKPRWQEFELDQFEPGRHELELVVGGDGWYYLRDILIEFFDDPPSHPSVDKDGGNLATIVEHADTDAEPSAIQDADVEEDTRNVNAVSPALENDVPSS